MTVDQKILGMTTLIKSQSKTYGYTSQGSGFFYSELADEPTGPVNEEKHLGWYKIEGGWLVTNRHVILNKVSNPDGTSIEVLPDIFQFFIRELSNGRIEWIPVTLSKEELKKRTKGHINPRVDVAIIKVEDLITELVLKNKGTQLLPPSILTNRDLPEKFPVQLEATSDVIICSYPLEFYDRYNKFPIIKSGIIASSWKSYFNGEPLFLVDAKLFPGSSGGLVLSKPVDVALIDGKLSYSKEKQFALLGVYSGQYMYNTQDKYGKEQKEAFGLGMVWYSHLIPEIIKNGTTL